MFKIKGTDIDPEPIHSVSLQQDVNEVLVEVDGYYILRITKRGLKRIGCVSKDTGLPVDPSGRVVVYND